MDMDEGRIAEAAAKLTAAFFNNQKSKSYGQELNDWTTVYGDFHDNMAMKARNDK